MSEYPLQRAKLNPWRPYAWLVEPEVDATGSLRRMATIFLVNRQCPFDCVMCDLWRYTTRDTIPAGAIVAQLQYARERMASCRDIKLYNAGNFFDGKAIPPEDRLSIAGELSGFRRVVIENHPRLTNDSCLHFRDALSGKLEVALGLETVHEPSLRRLNKRMTAADFNLAVRFLTSNGIAVRAFVLLWSPFLRDEEGIRWTVESTRYAFDCGVDIVSLVPLRITTPHVRSLVRQRITAPPTLKQIDEAAGRCHQADKGVVLVDLWDIEGFAACPRCAAARIARLREMNLTQSIPAPVTCHCDRIPV